MRNGRLVVSYSCLIYPFFGASLAVGCVAAEMMYAVDGLMREFVSL